jgi:hypothetical protein
MLIAAVIEAPQHLLLDIGEEEQHAVRGQPHIIDRRIERRRRIALCAEVQRRA